MKALVCILLFLAGMVAAEEPTIYRLVSGEEVHGFGITIETKESYFVRDEKGNMQTVKKADVLEVIKPQPKPAESQPKPVQKPMPIATTSAKEDAENDLKKFKQTIAAAEQDIAGINEKIKKVEQWANDERFRINRSIGDHAAEYHDLNNS
jgi:hypothetical protein